MAAKKTVKKSAKKSREKVSKRPAARVAKRAAKKAKATTAKRRVSAVPAGYRTVTPYMIVRGAGRALEFYAKAFGAREKVRMPGPDGSVMHAEMKIGDSMVMLADENPQWGAHSPESLGGSATHVMLYVKDADAFVARAVAAGCTVEQPLADMFWGDRYGKIRDPFGHAWGVATHKEDVTPKQMKMRMDAFFAQAAQGG